MGNLNKGKQDAKGRGISLLLLRGSSIQVLDFQSLFLRFIIYDHASKEKRKSRSEKQMMLLPNTEKAIFQGVEQRSLDQVFPTSPRLIHAIVGRLPWCSLSLYMMVSFDCTRVAFYPRNSWKAAKVHGYMAQSKQKVEELPWYQLQSEHA